MRVLGSRGVPARYGGFETLAQRLVEFGADLGVPVDVIGSRDADAPAWQRFLVKRGILRGLETPLVTFMSRNRRRVAGDSVLVVNPVNVVTAMVLARRDHRVALHLDGMEDRRAKWGPLGKWAHRTARRVAVRSSLTLIVDSRVIQDFYGREFGRETVYIPYGGCPTAETDPSHRRGPGAGTHFLVVARPEPENQILEICRAFALSSRSEQLLIVGAPARSTEYWRAVEREVAHEPRIRLLGNVWDRARLCDLYLDSVAVIHGHSVGGTNPSLVDALSHQVPVLAHDNPFNREVAGESASYWIDVDGLRALIEAQELSGDLLGVGRTVDQRFLWAHVVGSYMKIIS